MALSLRAEQKNLNKLFYSNDDIYVVPEYQRPYSWNHDTCLQLYSDITTAFLNDEDYFIGNIIMARGSDEPDKPRIVDGQQRLITLWLFLKVLSLLHPDKYRLSRTLCVESVLSDSSQPRIDTLVFEHNDKENIITALNISDEKLHNLAYSSHYNKEEKEFSRSHIGSNLIDIYKWIREFYSNFKDYSKSEEDFLMYFLSRVFLLPIEIGGKDIDNARNDALTIFETINNRGQLLEDSDIFKARLYNNAATKQQQADFIDQWTEFNNICSDLNISVDELFRYYYHILRAEDGTTTNESNLRDFFTHDANSALNTLPYDKIIEDLSKILNILQKLATKDLPKELLTWLQLIDKYSNQYPKYALVNYLFYKGFDDEIGLAHFVKTLVRYCYYRGATVQVKYEIYRINKQIAHEGDIDEYDTSDIDMTSFDHIGTLKNGYALLAHYIQYPSDYIENVSFDKLINSKDIKSLPAEWNKIQYDDIKNNIANIVVLDIPKRISSFREKCAYYLRSDLSDVNSMLDDADFHISVFKKRENHLKDVLHKFFINKR